MAEYVKYQDSDHTLWGGNPESHLGIMCRREEGEEDREKHVYYNDNWTNDLEPPQDTADSVSPALSSDNIYDLTSDPVTSESDDGYEVPVFTIERLKNQSNGGSVTANTAGQWELKDCGKGNPASRYETMNPLSCESSSDKKHGSGIVGKNAKFKPIPKKRKKKAVGLQDSMYCLAKSDSSLDSIDAASTPTHNPKTTLSRQRVIYPVKGGRGQALTGARKCRNRSRKEDRRAARLEPQPRGALGGESDRRNEQNRTADNRSSDDQNLSIMQQRSEDRFRQTRSNSIMADKFEDALEYLPEDWAPPPKPKSSEEGRGVEHGGGGGGGDGGGGTGGGAGGGGGGVAGGSGGGGSGGGDDGGGGSWRRRVTDPVTEGNYEEAWDLNPHLEAKLSRLRLKETQTQPQPQCQKDKEPGGGSAGQHALPGTKFQGEGDYLEPWDSSHKQQELEEKLQQARRGRRNPQTWCLLGARSPAESPPPEGCNSKRSSSQRVQSSCVEESCGQRTQLSSSGSVRSMPGCLGGPVKSTDCLQNQQWYHGNISRVDAEQMLRVCKEGSFLVRDSSDRCHYTLSIKCPSQIIHIQIDQSVTVDGGSLRYILGHNSAAFPTIPTMILHYSHHPVPIRGASHITLKYSLPH